MLSVRNVSAVAAVLVCGVAMTPAVALTVKGTDGPDLLTGTMSDDVIRGYAGDDRLWARGGADTATGGPGSDRIWTRDGGDFINAGTGSDYIDSGDGNDYILGDPRISGPDIFDRPGDGDDLVFSGDGRDYVSLFLGTNEAYLGPGNDIFENEYFKSNDTVFLGSGRDLATAYQGDFTIYGGPGDDSVSGGGGSSKIHFYGGRGLDYLSGPIAGETVAHGGDGPDRLNSTGHPAIAHGGDGPDWLSLYGYPAYASGGKGDDEISYDVFINFPEQVPEIDCGPGKDRVKVYYPYDSPPPPTPQYPNCEQVKLLPRY